MIKIICFGNPLHSDDGFGYHVYQRLNANWRQAFEMYGIDLIFAQCSGLDAVNYFVDADEVLIIDTQRPPQDVRRRQTGQLCHDVVTGVELSNTPLSTHRFDVVDAIAAMQAEGLAWPPIEVISVEAGDINAFCLDLSPGVAAAIEPCCQRVLSYLDQRGVQLEPLLVSGA